MDSVLLVGGAGYIGAHTAKYLAGQGYLPVVYDNLSRGHREVVKWGPLEIGDIADGPRLVEVLTKHAPVAVLHFAALAYVGESVTDPALYYRTNVAGTLSLLEAMRATGVNKIVFSSTCATYGVPRSVPIVEESSQNPINPYGRTKLMVEQVLADYGAAYDLKSMCLRYFNAAGADPDGEVGEDHEPETHLIPLVLEVAAGRRPSVDINGNDYPTPDGTCVRDFIHVTDLAQAHFLAVRHLVAGGASMNLNLGNGTGYSVRQVIDAAERVTGQKIAVVHRPRRPGDPPELVGSAEKARAVLGWRPEYASIDSIIGTAWTWHSRGRHAPASGSR
ncbi:MAG TPA: UDP-glucose 4-epimerase GalE [Polyangia bacterium]|nr:UDP-glucose 4-epimerase GalE [Polyangia bacterium]